MVLSQVLVYQRTKETYSSLESQSMPVLLTMFSLKTVEFWEYLMSKAEKQQPLLLFTQKCFLCWIYSQWF